MVFITMINGVSVKCENTGLSILSPIIVTSNSLAKVGVRTSVVTQMINTIIIATIVVATRIAPDQITIGAARQVFSLSVYRIQKTPYTVLCAINIGTILKVKTTHGS